MQVKTQECTVTCIMTVIKAQMLVPINLEPLMEFSTIFASSFNLQPAKYSQTHANIPLNDVVILQGVAFPV